MVDRRAGAHVPFSPPARPGPTLQIEIIGRSLRGAYNNTPEGRDGMALAQYVAGMGELTMWSALVDVQVRSTVL